LQAVHDLNAAPLLEAADEEHHEWLGMALSRPVANLDAVVEFLTGTTPTGQPISISFYGCMQQYCRVGLGWGG